MKRSHALIFLVLGAAFIFAADSANAQVSQQYRARIPFDFTAGGKSFAAGDYEIGNVSSGTTTLAVNLIEKKTGRSRFLGLNIAADGRRDNSRAKLTFVRNGHKNDLREISTATIRMQLKRPKKFAIAQNTESAAVTIYLDEYSTRVQ